MSYQSSTKNKYHEKDNEVYYDFKVIGPRGSTQVELTATKLKAKEVYEYDSENESLKLAEAKYDALQQELNELTSKSTKKSGNSKWFGNKKEGVVEMPS